MLTEAICASHANELDSNEALLIAVSMIFDAHAQERNTDQLLGISYSTDAD